MKDALRWIKFGLPYAVAAAATTVSRARDTKTIQKLGITNSSTEENTMTNKALSILDHIGNVLKSILHIGTEVATIAQPFVSAAFPNIAPLYASVLGLAYSEQATADATTGTGAQKLANLVTNLTPQFQEWAKTNGIVMDEAQITKWASAVVDTLKLIPAPSVAPAAATVEVPTAATSNATARAVPAGS